MTIDVALGLGALIGSLGELELECGVLCFFALVADFGDFGGGAVYFSRDAGVIKGVADELVGVDDIEAGGVSCELDVGTDASEGVVDGLLFSLGDSLVDFAVECNLGGADAESLAVCRGDFEFRRLSYRGDVEFTGTVEHRKDAAHEGSESGAVEGVSG